MKVLCRVLPGLFLLPNTRHNSRIPMFLHFSLTTISVSSNMPKTPLSHWLVLCSVCIGSYFFFLLVLCSLAGYCSPTWCRLPCSFSPFKHPVNEDAFFIVNVCLMQQKQKSQIFFEDILRCRWYIWGFFNLFLFLSNGSLFDHLDKLGESDLQDSSICCFNITHHTYSNSNLLYRINL